MTIRQGTYYPASSKCVGAAENDVVELMSFLTTRVPGSRNGGMYGCRNVAGSTVRSVHNGRAGDWMTQTGKPTTESLFMAEQLRLFSVELGIQGLIHNRKAWWCNHGVSFAAYNGSNPHVDHIHYEQVPGDDTSTTEISKVLIGPSVNGNHLFAGAVVQLGKGNGGPARYVQMRLIAHGFGIGADGIAGPKTVAAITTFQKLAGLSVDGIAGPATQGRLR